jgi:hypothetical protein
VEQGAVVVVENSKIEHSGLGTEALENPQSVNSDPLKNSLSFTAPHQERHLRKEMAPRTRCATNFGNCTQSLFPTHGISIPVIATPPVVTVSFCHRRHTRIALVTTIQGKG